MTEAEFWKIISLFDWEQTGDDDAVLEPAVAALARRSADEIIAFEEILAEKLFRLDTEHHARSIGVYAYTGEEDGFSVDNFLYARCVVVANGERLFAAVLRDPAKMPKDMEFEALLGLARSAYDRAGYGELDHLTARSYETFSNKDGWPRPQS